MGRKIIIEMQPPKKQQNKPRTQREMAHAARRRHAGYENMSAEAQWEEDKRLGILDWDGKTG